MRNSRHGIMNYQEIWKSKKKKKIVVLIKWRFKLFKLNWLIDWTIPNNPLKKTSASVITKVFLWNWQHYKICLLCYGFNSDRIRSSPASPSSVSRSGISYLFFLSVTFSALIRNTRVTLLFRGDCSFTDTNTWKDPPAQFE